MSRVKFVAKFQNLNFCQFFKTCNFDFVLFWLRIWCEPLVWIIMGWRRASQNAGVSVVLVVVSYRWISPISCQVTSLAQKNLVIIPLPMEQPCRIRITETHEHLFSGKIACANISLFKWLKFFIEYKWWLLEVNLHKMNCLSSLNHYPSVKILPFLW